MEGILLEMVPALEGVGPGSFCSPGGVITGERELINIKNWVSFSLGIVGLHGRVPEVFMESRADLAVHANETMSGVQTSRVYPVDLAALAGCVCCPILWVFKGEGTNPTKRREVRCVQVEFMDGPGAGSQVSLPLPRGGGELGEVGRGPVTPHSKAGGPIL